MHAGDELVATDARHAVVERYAADAFVPNDVTLDAAAHQLVILTGPNMGGKSTYLRQTALLCLMAQAGSFVPARTRQAADRRSPVRARRRVRQHRPRPVHVHGRDAGDGEHPALRDVAQPGHPRRDRPRHVHVRRPQPRLGGRRAPGVEHAARGRRPSSRRTTTSSPTSRTRCPRVANFHVVVREWKDDIVFLRKVVPGRSDRSYGIQVARLAGLPPSVVARAREILNGLERDELSRGGRPSLSGSAADRQQQLGLFQAPPPEDDPIHRRLRELDINEITPLQALAMLAELKDEAG